MRRFSPANCAISMTSSGKTCLSGYVPTILGYERHKPAQPGFERRLTRRVFRELNLPGRPLFERSPVLQFGAALAEPAQQLRHAGRAAIGVLASVMLVMVMSMVFATPSFADGLQILLGHTGVQQVADYPRNVHDSAPPQSKSAGDADSAVLDGSDGRRLQPTLACASCRARTGRRGQSSMSSMC